MDSSIQLFENGDWRLRAIEIDGEPWFVARDVTDAPELDRTATRRLDDDEKGVRSMHTPGGDQQISIISEPGLYNLALSSKKPEAHAFRRWVTHDVIPAIRRHGMYATPQTVEDMLADPDTMIATLQALKAERAKVAMLEEDNAKLLPGATMYDIAIAADGTMTVTEAARFCRQYDKRVTRNTIYAQLRAHELVCKRGNAPTQKAIDAGYAVQVLSQREDGKANPPYARLTRKGLDWVVRNCCKAKAAPDVS